MRVRDLIRAKSDTVITVQSNDELSTAIRLLMRHNIGGRRCSRTTAASSEFSPSATSCAPRTTSRSRLPRVVFRT